MTQYSYHAQMHVKDDGFHPQHDTWRSHRMEPVQGHEHRRIMGSLQPLGPRYIPYTDSDSQQAAQALTSLYSNPPMLNDAVSYECTDPHCDSDDIIPCYSNHEAGQLCSELCERIICNDEDCDYSATCEWAIKDGESCKISLRDKQTLYQHISRDHIQPQSMAPTLRCGDRVPFDQAAQHMVQHATEDPHDSISAVWTCLYPLCPFVGHSSEELAHHVESSHDPSYPECSWGGCHQTAISTAELQTHVYTHHLCVNPKDLFNSSTGTAPLMYHSPSQNIRTQGDFTTRDDFFGKNDYPGLSPSASQSPNTISSDVDATLNISPMSIPAMERIMSNPSVTEGNWCLWEAEGAEICGESFQDANSVQIHVESEHLSTGKRKRAKNDTGEVAALACKWKGCKQNENNKVYDQLQHLKEHLVTHTKYRAVACSECEKPFVDKKALEQHMRTHTGERPFKCPFCDSSFGAKATLTTHMRQHTGEKPYYCEECGHRDADHANFKRHLAKHKPPQHECEICHVKFTKKANLTRHIRTKHRDLEEKRRL